MDYESIGLMVGIECHQQLETRKLFCNCPSIVHDKHPDIKVLRKLRAVIGETGEIDKAAAHEQSRSRIMCYEACSTSSCLVELDEEPPHPMNPEAVEIALHVAKLLKAKVVDEIQVMRKTVIDGSNVSGFQRTAMVAYDGIIETSLGDVGVPAICLEEEAAKKVREDEGSITYRLDRLGVPLIEIGTAPDIKTPEHAKETAQKIGMILRSTGKMKRGIGTIRQDVNVSIKGGTRVEIKGFQDLKSIPFVIEGEILRQQKRIKEKGKVASDVRKAETDGSTTFLRPMPGSARMYPETDVLPIRPEKINIKDVELIDDRIERFISAYGLGRDLATVIAKSCHADLFEDLKCKNLKPAFIAEMLVSVPREARRKHKVDISDVPDALFKETFTYLDEGKISKDVVTDVILSMNEGTFDISEYATISDDKLRAGIESIIKELDGKPFGAIMGEVMKRYQGKVDGRKASAIIKELLR